MAQSYKPFVVVAVEPVAAAADIALDMLAEVFAVAQARSGK